mgnify:CR=1 FL=1
MVTAASVSRGGLPQEVPFGVELESLGSGDGHVLEVSSLFLSALR